MTTTINIEIYFKITILILLYFAPIHRLGGVCIHVSALLQLAIKRSAKNHSVDGGEFSDDENVVPVTSRTCTWNKPSQGPVSY